MNAVENVVGPCVVLAGAGTGKTHTIVEKVKYILDKKIYPSQKIVCITFSNEAANNLSLRIKNFSNLGPLVRTFHGFSADLLRKYGERIDLPKNFKILDPDQAMVMLHRNLKVNAMLCQKYISTIGSVKDLGISLDDFRTYLDLQISKYSGIDMLKKLEELNFELQTLHLRKEFWKKKDLANEIKKIKRIIDLKKFVTIWSSYEKMKKKGSYQDYSDLAVNSIILIDKFPEISEDFDYFIVDEFQDTNKMQLDFLVKLVKNGNITVVGDLNQSIYRFRGAYSQNIEFFKKSFNVKPENIFNLSKSYRSTNVVLRAAHKLIVKNYSNVEDCFFVESAQGKEGESIEVFELKNAGEEARKIVEIVKEQESKGVPLEEICIMFRAHQYSKIIKKALEKESVPYYSVVKSSLLKQKSVKTAHDYLIILNKLKKKEKGGEQAWWDLVYQLDFNQSDLIYIGKTIKSFSKKNESSGENKDLLSVYLFNNLDKFELSSEGKIASKIIIDKLKLMLDFTDKPVSELLKEIYRISGLANEEKTILEKEIMMNLNKFYEIAKTHEDIYDSDLSNFLYYLDILNELNIDIDSAQLEERGVRLMTSHSTKGLEYKVVIISNFASGRFPLERYVGNNLIPIELLPELKNELTELSEEEKESFILDYEKKHQLMEERRLAYVSFTRTKDKLFLTYAQEYGDKPVSPSIFLKEIEYQENKDISFSKDLEIKFSNDSPEKKNVQFSSVMNYQNFDEILETMSQNTVKKEIKRFSPSALILFSDCQKEFEYKYVYNMPERKTFSWEAMRMGSFIHLVLEKGVNSGFKRVEDFIALMNQLSLEENWQGLELNEIETLIRVFFERNKDKYNAKSKTEEHLFLNLSGIQFMGFADRIDISEKGVEIVDYKTGKTNVSPKDRNWQLGFYALAAQERYGKVRKVVLDMLKQDKPLEFEIDELGNAKCLSSKFIPGFNIYEVEKEILIEAKKIQEAYKSGFKPCSIEKNCEFCSEYVYGL